MKKIFLTEATLLAFMVTFCSAEVKPVSYYVNNIEEAKSVYKKCDEKIRSNENLDHEFNQNCINATKVYNANKELEFTKEQLNDWLDYYTRDHNFEWDDVYFDEFKVEYD